MNESSDSIASAAQGNSSAPTKLIRIFDSKHKPTSIFINELVGDFLHSMQASRATIL